MRNNEFQDKELNNGDWGAELNSKFNHYLEPQKELVFPEITEEMLKAGDDAVLMSGSHEYFETVPDCTRKEFLIKVYQAMASRYCRKQ